MIHRTLMFQPKKTNKQKKTVQIKDFLFERYDSNHLITDFGNQNISFFEGELHGLTYQIFSKVLLIS